MSLYYYYVVKEEFEKLLQQLPSSKIIILTRKMAFFGMYQNFNLIFLLKPKAIITGLTEILATQFFLFIFPLIILMTLVTQPMLQLRLNWTELRSMDY